MRPEQSEMENIVDKIVSDNINSYQHLINYNNQTRYWQAVVKAICYAESGFNQFSIYWEATLGSPIGYDPVTKMKYLSEGLMQLSYSDSVYHHCDFDVEADRNKSDRDKTKTIFVVEKNIKCGLQILDEMVKKHGEYVYNHGNYWASLKPHNKAYKTFLERFNQYL